jgi:hypothetical protein
MIEKSLKNHWKCIRKSNFGGYGHLIYITNSIGQGDLRFQWLFVAYILITRWHPNGSHTLFCTFEISGGKAWTCLLLRQSVLSRYNWHGSGDTWALSGVNFSERKIVGWLLNASLFIDLPYSSVLLPLWSPLFPCMSILLWLLLGDSRLEQPSPTLSFSQYSCLEGVAQS